MAKITHNSMHRLVVKALVTAQAGICPICWKPMHSEKGVSLDHVWPSKGSKKPDMTIGNLTIAHANCNAEKGGMMPTGCHVIMLHRVNAVFGVEVPEVKRNPGVVANPDPITVAEVKALPSSIPVEHAHRLGVQWPLTSGWRRRLLKRAVDAPC